MTISNAFTKTFGNTYKNFKGDIGLEIETETDTDYKVPKFSFWSVHADGSLRGFGQEYVLKQPLDFATAFPEALIEFRDKTKGIPFNENSITTSVHVHLNFLNDDFVVLGNFLTTYAFVENILIRFSGDDRLSNLFCLPICDAEETYHNIMRIVEALPKKKYGSLQFEVDNTKYGALNLSALVRYGSLEIRSFRGTTDIELIRTWVGVLYSILQYSRQKGLTPPQIIQAYRDKGAEVLSDIFGEYRKILRHKDEDALLDQNLWYAVNISCAVKDWDKLEEVPKTTKPKLKDLDKMARSIYNQSFEALTHEQQQLVLRRAEQETGAATATETLGEWTGGTTTTRPLGGLRTGRLEDFVATMPMAREDRPIGRDDAYEILFTPDIDEGDEDDEDTVTWDGVDYVLRFWQRLVRDTRTGRVYVRDMD